MSRHLSALFRAWGNESKRRKATKRKRVETMFLPAALEIMETPPRPLGRIILWTIVLASACAFAWALLAKVDIVAVSEGRVVPRGRLQSVETSEAGVVRALLAREGDRVVAGQPLIELDPTYAEADAEASKSELATAYLQKARATALLDYADGKSWSIEQDERLEPSFVAAEEALVAARIRGHEAKLASFEERLSAADYAAKQAKTELDSVNETIPFVQRQYESRAELADQGYAPRIQADELEERLTTLRYQAKVKAAEIDKTRAEYAMIQRDIKAEKEAFRISAGSELSEAESIIATRSEIVSKAERRTALQTLTAPVSGVINEITLTTIGEVAQPGEPLMTLVPEGDELILEAFVLNKDIGFVKKGQKVTIKLEAYSFMRYGFLVGEIEHVSADSIIDQSRGLVYPARVRIVSSRLRFEDRPSVNSLNTRKPPNNDATPVGNVDEVEMREKDLNAQLVSAGILSPGMTAAIEIKTGRRSVLSFLLSPIGRSMKEAGRER